MEMSYISNTSTDTFDHHREFFAAPIPLQNSLPGAMVKVDMHDEGHRAIEIGVFLDGVCVGELRGRFGETARQLGCQFGEALGVCECRDVGVKWEDMGLMAGAGGNILCIEAINVEDCHRRKGIGRVLAETMVERAALVGVKHVILVPMDLEPHSDDMGLYQAAKSFWCAMGYRQIGGSTWYELPIRACHPSLGGLH